MRTLLQFGRSWPSCLKYPPHRQIFGLVPRLQPRQGPSDYALGQDQRRKDVKQPPVQSTDFSGTGDVPVVVEGSQAPANTINAIRDMKASIEGPNQAGITIEYAYNTFRANPERYPFARAEVPPAAAKIESGREAEVNHAKIVAIVSGITTREEAFQAWTLMARLSNTDILDWEESRLHLATQKIVELIPEFSDVELLQSVQQLSWTSRYHPPKPKVMHDIKTALDLASAKRLQNFQRKVQMLNGQVTLKAEAPELLFLFRLTNVWFKLGILASRNISTWSCRYLRLFVSTFAQDQMIPKLNHGQFVFLVFVMGMLRKCPVEIRDLSGAFGDQLGNYLTEATLAEGGILAHGLHQIFTVITTRDVKVREEFLRLLNELDYRDILKEELGISMIFKILKRRGSANFKEMNLIQNKFKPHLDAMSMVAKVRLLALMVEPNVGDTNDFVKAFCKSALVQLPNARLKDYLQAIQVLHKSRCLDNTEIFKCIMELVTDGKRQNLKSGKMFIQLMSILSNEKVFKDQFLEEIFAHTNAYSGEFFGSESTDFIKTIVRFSFEFTRPERHMEEIKEHIVEFESQRSRSLVQNLMHHICNLDANMRLDYPEYPGLRLTPEVRAKLVSFVSKRPKPNGSRIQKAQMGVRSQLCKMFKEEHMGEHYLLPQAQHMDTVLAFDLLPQLLSRALSSRKLAKAVAPFPYNTYWDNLQNEHIMPKDHYCPQNIHWVALVVPKIEHLDIGGEPNGVLFHKLRHLSHLGFAVCIIQDYAFNRAMAKGHGTDFLWSRIAKALKEKGLNS